MIGETLTDKKVSVVVSIDKNVSQVCYDVCKSDLYILTLLHVIRKVPGDVKHKCSTPFFFSCTSMTFVVRS
jgi:hypothetical protein